MQKITYPIYIFYNLCPLKYDSSLNILPYKLLSLSRSTPTVISNTILLTNDYCAFVALDQPSDVILCAPHITTMTILAY